MNHDDFEFSYNEFVPREECYNFGTGESCIYVFEKIPILITDVSGSIYFKDKLIQNYQVLPSGILELMLCMDFSVKVVSGFLDFIKGELTLNWNQKIGVGESKIVSSYQAKRSVCDFTHPNNPLYLMPKIHCPRCQSQFYEFLTLFIEENRVFN